MENFNKSVESVIKKQIKIVEQKKTSILLKIQ